MEFGREEAVYYVNARGTRGKTHISIFRIFHVHIKNLHFFCIVYKHVSKVFLGLSKIYEIKM